MKRRTFIETLGLGAIFGMLASKIVAKPTAELTYEVLPVPQIGFPCNGDLVCQRKDNHLDIYSPAGTYKGCYDPKQGRMV